MKGDHLAEFALLRVGEGTDFSLHYLCGVSLALHDVVHHALHPDSGVYNWFEFGV